jgi:hypothetical protein
VDQLGASRRREGLEALAERGPHLLESHGRSLERGIDAPNPVTRPSQPVHSPWERDAQTGGMSTLDFCVTVLLWWAVVSFVTGAIIGRILRGVQSPSSQHRLQPGLESRWQHRRQ